MPGLCFYLNWCFVRLLWGVVRKKKIFYNNALAEIASEKCSPVKSCKINLHSFCLANRGVLQLLINGCGLCIIYTLFWVYYFMVVDYLFINIYIYNDFRKQGSIVLFIDVQTRVNGIIFIEKDLVRVSWNLAICCLIIICGF